MQNDIENILNEIAAKDSQVLCREVLSIGDTMDVLRSKWTVEILTAILCGNTRFKDILTEVPELPDVDAEPFQVTITPNPANDNLTITTNYEKGRASVVFISPQGAKVRGFSMQGSTTVDVSDLPSGIYFVHVIGGKVVTRKVVIQH